MGYGLLLLFGSDLSNVTTVFRYRIFPHAGTWEDADIWTENETYTRRPVCFTGEALKNGESLLGVGTDGVEVSAFFVEDGNYYVRLFNHRDAQTASVRLGEKFLGAVECTHDKKPTGEPVRKDAQGVVSCQIPRFGVRTLRLLTE